MRCFPAPVHLTERGCQDSYLHYVRLSWGLHHIVKSSILPIEVKSHRTDTQVWQTKLFEHDMACIFPHVGLICEIISKMVTDRKK